MMRAESSILGSVEIAGGVAIAAAVREIADSSCRSHIRSVMAPSCLLLASRARERCGEPWPVRPSPTRPWEVIGFEELLSELIARARMLRPHLVSRLVSKLLAYGARCRTLSCEERCGRMIANPVKSLAHRPLPALGARGWRCVPLESCLYPSKLATGAV